MQVVLVRCVSGYLLNFQKGGIKQQNKHISILQGIHMGNKWDSLYLQKGAKTCSDKFPPPCEQTLHEFM